MDRQNLSSEGGYFGLGGLSFGEIGKVIANVVENQMVSSPMADNKNIASSGKPACNDNYNILF